MRPFALAFFILRQMKIEDCYKVGYVMKPHGLKGQVTISLEKDFPVEELPAALFVDDNLRLVPYLIQEISVRGDKAFVKFEDVDTLEAATSVSRKALYLPKTSRPASRRGEFYDDEVIGFQVHDSVHGLIGDVKEVTLASANQLLVVQKGNDEVLIPLNSPFITSVNRKKKTIAVELPEGYLDI
jgi:16S rRNA processing protein RimM